MSDLRYPIGKFYFGGSISEEQQSKFIDDIAQAPTDLRNAVKGLLPEQLDNSIPRRRLGPFVSLYTTFLTATSTPTCAINLPLRKTNRRSSLMPKIDGHY